ncbi:MAG: putative Ig domain-containing protein [Steroidobacteraceae bacterium]
MLIKTESVISHLPRIGWGVVAALVLAGCGGGSGSADATSAQTAPPASDPAPPAPPVAPTISGTPVSSVNSGTKYTFTPSAKDPSGKSLTFNVQNKPAWASFDAASGTLSGTPDAASVGNYGNIVISVSNGAASASLPTFSITVSEVANGSATVSWVIPTQNVDGSPVTNLAGFHVYYGTAADSMTQMAQIANAGVATYVISNLSPATWYFGVKAYTSTGAESAISNVASKTIR